MPFICLPCTQVPVNNFDIFFHVWRLCYYCYGKSPHFPSVVMVRFHSEVILTRFNLSLLKENIYVFIISCKVKALLFTEIYNLLSMQFFFSRA